MAANVPQCEVLGGLVRTPKPLALWTSHHDFNIGLRRFDFALDSGRLIGDRFGGARLSGFDPNRPLMLTMIEWPVLLLQRSQTATGLYLKAWGTIPVRGWAQ